MSSETLFDAYGALRRCLGYKVYDGVDGDRSKAYAAAKQEARQYQLARSALLQSGPLRTGKPGKAEADSSLCGMAQVARRKQQKAPVSEAERLRAQRQRLEHQEAHMTARLALPDLHAKAREGLLAKLANIQQQICELAGVDREAS